MSVWKGRGVQEEAPADDWRLVCTSCFAIHMKGKLIDSTKFLPEPSDLAVTCHLTALYLTLPGRSYHSSSILMGKWKINIILYCIDKCRI